MGGLGEPTQLKLLFDGEATELEPGSKAPSRHPWAWLLQRVFAVDIMFCPRCRGAMRLVEIATMATGSPEYSPPSGSDQGHRRDKGRRSPASSS